MPVFNTSKIKNIIFDLGGVLLNINPLLSLEEISKSSGLDKQTLINRFTESGIFEKFDTGQYNPDQFRCELCRLISKNVTDSEIDRMWNALLLDFPPQRLKMIQELKKNYRVYLLSNTNSIHFLHYTKVFNERYNLNMPDLFDRLFLSYELGMHKPDMEIYCKVLELAGLDASECLFVDDSLPNIEAARQQGIACIHISGDHDVTHYFPDGLISEYRLPDLNN
jgi:glucose-1-phosphatase